MERATRPQFVLFGSSIVQFSFGNVGWGANLTDMYARQADIVLRGYSGWNSRCALKVLEKVFPKDAGVQPSLVIVYFGGNDSVAPHPSGLGPHVPISEYVENMRKIATHLKGLSNTTRLIFLGAPPVNEKLIEESQSSMTCTIHKELVRTNELCGKYSKALIELCREMDLQVIDLWTAIQKKDDWLTTCFVDGIHFSAEGSNIVTQEIHKVLKEANWEPSLHWESMAVEFLDVPSSEFINCEEIYKLIPSKRAFHQKVQCE